MVSLSPVHEDATVADRTDFDLHGMVGVRVVGTPADASVIRRQLGPMDGQLDRLPDIVIRFVDILPTGRLTLVGRNEFGHDEHGFYLLRAKGKCPVRIRMDLDQLDDRSRPFEIIVERGAPAVPLLISLINLFVLASGAVALHACAFEYRGIGVVVTGWSKGGKTEALLAMLAAGARYVGDEWVYIHGDGSTVSGIPEPVRVWDWYLHQIPDADRLTSRSDRTRLRLLAGAGGLGDLVGRGRLGDRAARLARRLDHLIRSQRYVDVDPQVLSGGDLGTLHTTFDLLVLAESTPSPLTSTTRIDAGEVASAMAASLAYERQPLVEAHEAFRYSFPRRRAQFLESAGELEERRLGQVFDRKPTWRLEHPYPAVLDDLGRALSPILGGER